MIHDLFNKFSVLSAAALVIMAVLHCQAVAWLSPGAAALARQIGAEPCEGPPPTDLVLRAPAPG